MNETHSFKKKVENTFSCLSTFINEVEEIGFFEKVSFVYNFHSNFEDKTCHSYYRILKELLDRLQIIVEDLQSSSQVMHNNLLNSTLHQGTASENEAIPFSGDYLDNIPYEENPALENNFKKSEKYKGIFTYDSSINFSKELNENSYIKLDSSLRMMEKTSKEFYEPVYQGQFYSSNSLVVPFENLAITSQMFNHEMTNSVSDQLHPTTTGSEHTLTSVHSGIESLVNRDQSLASCPTVQKQVLRSENRSLHSEEMQKINEVAEESSTIKPKHNSKIKSWKEKKKRSKATHVCTFCNHEFKSMKQLAAHSKKHCNEEGSNRNSQDQETEAEVESNLPVFCCKSCNVACRSLSSFKIHTCDLPDEGIQVPKRILIKNIRNLQQLRKFVCDICGTEFRSLKRILYHQPRCLPGPYGCNVCPEIFYSLKDLNYHKKKDHKNEKCFSCDECGKTFYRKASLRKHCVNRHESKAFVEMVNNIGNNSATFKCDYCSKKFIKKIFLTNHQIRAHGLEKNYLCQVCGKKFMTKNSLAVHKDLHKGEKKFACKYCDTRFHRKEKLINHERMHTGEKPFNCYHCGKVFVSRTKLNEHERRHDAEKRFQCQHCVNKSYASLGDLKKHTMKIHKMLVQSESVKVTLKKKSGRSETSTGQVDLEANANQIPLYGQAESNAVSMIQFNENIEGHCIPNVVGSQTNSHMMLQPMNQNVFSHATPQDATLHFSDI